MSLVHYISIGRFEAASDMPQPTLMQRVLAHFEPDGLARLGAPAASTPLTDQELDRLEQVLKEAWGLRVNVRSCVRNGVLSVPYTGEGIYRIAWPLAAVAREELGLTVAERGRPLTDAQISAAAAASRADNEVTFALLRIEGGEARVHAVAEQIRGGRRNPHFAHELLEGLGSEIVPTLASLLTKKARPDRGGEHLHWSKGGEAGLPVFACHALGALGPAAVAAVPAFEELFRREQLDRSLAHDATHALAKIGPAAEPALALALAHEAVRETALVALAAIPDLAPETRACIARAHRKPRTPPARG